MSQPRRSSNQYEQKGAELGSRLQPKELSISSSPHRLWVTLGETNDTMRNEFLLSSNMRSLYDNEGSNLHSYGDRTEHTDVQMPVGATK